MSEQLVENRRGLPAEGGGACFETGMSVKKVGVSGGRCMESESLGVRLDGHGDYKT